jgi:enoyl-CoA hydratase/carnithine racemase
MSERVSVSIADGIADVRMTRTDKRNALDAAQFAAIIEAGESLKSEPGLRAVVLSGEGRSFCAGIDLGGFQRANAGAAPQDRDAEPEHPAASFLRDGAITHVGQQACWVWQELPVPVIAAVHGHALGGGFQLALGADIRFVHPDTQLSLREVYWGLVPDMTGTLTLASLVRSDVLKDLLFTARIFDGREGLELGVVSKLTDDPYEDAHEYARVIAGQNPDAVRAGKELLNRFYHQRAAEQFASERDLIRTLSGTANQAETIRANLENRPAVYPA